jgi:hypothetical protein
MVRIEGDELAWTWPLLVQFADTELQLAMVVEDLPAGGPDGYLSMREKRIVVAARLPLNERAAVSFHELAHALVRVQREAGDFALNYASEELVVETVAYIVASTLGIDTTASSIPYLASWASSAPIASIEHAAKLIDTIAGRIESALLDDDGQPRTPAPADEPGCDSCSAPQDDDGYGNLSAGCADRFDSITDHAHLAAELAVYG